MENDIVVLIGKRIRQLRDQAGLSQTQLAKRAGLHVTYVGQVERGEKAKSQEVVASIKTVQKIAQALNVPITHLFSADTNKYQSSDRAILQEIQMLMGKAKVEQKGLLLQVARRILKK